MSHIQTTYLDQATVSTAAKIIDHINADGLYSQAAFVHAGIEVIHITDNKHYIIRPVGYIGNKNPTIVTSNSRTHRLSEEEYTILCLNGTNIFKCKPDIQREYIESYGET